MARHFLRATIVGLVCVFAGPLFAQSEPQQPARPDSTESPLRRWLDVQVAALSLRYRVIETSADVVAVNQLQHRESLRARITFDAQGRYSLHVGLFTGNAFTSRWNATGAGTGNPTGKVYLKQLFVSASPTRSLDLQFGGIYVLRGENTEITSYDDDGYLVGGRIIVHTPEHLFFNEISGTLAHLGDVFQPNVFKRFDDLGDVNYRQILVGKRVGKAIGTSFDYTDADGARTVRGAIALTELALLHLDALRLELYRRINEQPAGGLAITADRS